MTVNEILGYARAILDQFGLTTFITVIVLISAAAYVYSAFIRRD